MSWWAVQNSCFGQRHSLKKGSLEDDSHAEATAESRSTFAPHYSVNQEPRPSRRIETCTATIRHQAQRVAISGMTFSLLMWFVILLSVGGEWFLMWQSKMWNG
jgi:hypothetical protein